MVRHQGRQQDILKLMDNKLSLAEYKDEVLRKIGRNMLLFQQIEHILKYVVLNSDFDSSLSSFQRNLDKRNKSIMRTSLGNLVREYVESTLSKYDGNGNLTEELKEPHINLRCRWELSEAQCKKRKVDLESIVADRNRLIHNLLPQFDPGSINSCIETINWLDDQHKKLLPQLEEIRGLAKTLQEARETISRFLNSKEGEKMFLEMVAAEKK